MSRLITVLAALLFGAAVTIGLTATGAVADPTGSVSPSPSGSPSVSPSTTSPSSASTTPATGPGELTVTVATNCSTYSIDATIENGTAAAVTVEVSGQGAAGPFPKTVTVAAGDTGILRVPAKFGNEYNLTFIRLDPDNVVGSFFSEFFTCPTRADFSIRVVSGTMYTSRPICPLLGPGRAAHGTTGRSADSVTYTPDPGYIGPDRFDYNCVTSAEQFGTFFVTVLPAAARPVQPARPAPPTLPATGAVVGPELAVGTGLLLAGLLALWLVHFRAARRAGHSPRAAGARNP